LDYVIEAAYLRKFTETGDYAGIAVTLHDIYKEDIVNPYTEVKGHPACQIISSAPTNSYTT